MSEDGGGLTLEQQVAALVVAPMTDEELAEYLGLSPDQMSLYLPNVSTEERAMYDYMRKAEMLMPLWESGVEPYPSDAIVNRRPRKVRPNIPTQE